MTNSKVDCTISKLSRKALRIYNVYGIQLYICKIYAHINILLFLITTISLIALDISPSVKLKANANMKGILLGASRGTFPDMSNTQLHESSLQKVSHCPRTVTQK